MKSYLRLTLLLCSCLLLSSCFELLEDIKINSDGSGTIKTTLNLSKSSTKVAALMKLKNVNGIEIPTKEKIKAQTKEMADLLKTTPGISQVDYQLDFNNYIASVSCNFTSISALNTFSKALATHFKSTLGDNNNYNYNAKTGIFKRSYIHADTFSKSFAKVAEADRKYFDDAYYTQIIRFDKTIKSQQHPAAKISSSAKSSLLKLKITALANGKASLGNTITLNNN